MKSQRCNEITFLYFNCFAQTTHSAKKQICCSMTSSNFSDKLKFRSLWNDPTFSNKPSPRNQVTYLDNMNLICSSIIILGRLRRKVILHFSPRSTTSYSTHMHKKKLEDRLIHAKRLHLPPI